MIVLYKEAGITINQFIESVKEKYPNNKIAYAGRLDPMARGLIPILFDDECNDMKSYTSKDKVYRVKVIVGIATDTDDPLGIITHETLIQDINYLVSKYKDIFTKPMINFNQMYHYFSTKEINRRKKKKDTTIPSTHIVSLYSSTILSTGSIDTKEWIESIITIIDSIDKTKDFRQKTTIEQWEQFNSDSIQYIELELNVSSGFFVRQFIRDISITIGIPLMCYDIHRFFI